MRARLPAARALEYYLDLGPRRSYPQVAAHFEVHRSTVLAAAKKGDWQRRAREHDDAKFAKEHADLAAEVEAARARQLAIVRHVIGKALEGLKAKPLNNAKDCLKALEMGLDQERKILENGSADQQLQIV